MFLSYPWWPCPSPHCPQQYCSPPCLSPPHQKSIIFNCEKNILENIAFQSCPAIFESNFFLPKTRKKGTELLKNNNIIFGIKKLTIFTNFWLCFYHFGRYWLEFDWYFFLDYVLKIMLINPYQLKSTHYFIHKSIIKYCDIAIFVVRELPLLWDIS